MSRPRCGECAQRIAGVLILVLVPAVARPQDQALYFDGAGPAATFTPPASRTVAQPTGAVEFWIRSDPAPPAPGQAGQVALDLSAAQCAPLPLRAVVEAGSGGRRLSLSLLPGQRAQPIGILELPDDQWHFVAVTSQRKAVAVYLDAAKSHETALTTARGKASTGPCYIGGSASGSHFRGAIDGLTLWSTPRSAAQVLADMSGFPPIEANTPGLVARFDFDEGAGSTRFKDRARRFRGTVAAKQWTTPLAADPTLPTEGIWLVIQPQAEVATDVGLPARRIALRTAGPNGEPTAASLPENGSLDEFLWRLQPTGDRFRLHNRALGDGHALTLRQGRAVMLPTNPRSAGQQLTIATWDPRRGGLNTFLVSNRDGSAGAVALTAADTVGSTGLDPRSRKQAWVFQPMYPLATYHIPSSLPEGGAGRPPVEPPYSKVLELPHGFVLRATTTVSDWAVLNAHNIYSNIFAAITYETTGELPASLESRSAVPLGDEGPPETRSVSMISRYDLSDQVCRYPDTYTDCSFVERTRGHGGSVGDARTLITEELMCNVFRRENGSSSYSEFDQVVHEITHTLDNGLFSPAQISERDRGTRWSKTHPAGNLAIEWFPNRVQQWFNSRHVVLVDDQPAFYDAAPKNLVRFTREMLKPDEAKQDAELTFAQSARRAGGRRYLATFFADGDDYWLPPRCLPRVPR